jgi:hypothetical protein
VHEWALRIDKSDRGHVFVGVVSADASMESYIGSDRYIIRYDTSVITLSVFDVMTHTLKHNFSPTTMMTLCYLQIWVGNNRH